MIPMPIKHVIATITVSKLYLIQSHFHLMLITYPHQTVKQRTKTKYALEVYRGCRPVLHLSVVQSRCWHGGDYSQSVQSCQFRARDTQSVICRVEPVIIVQPDCRYGYCRKLIFIRSLGFVIDMNHVVCGAKQSFNIMQLCVSGCHSESRRFELVRRYT